MIAIFQIQEITIVSLIGSLQIKIAITQHFESQLYAYFSNQDILLLPIITYMDIYVLFLHICPFDTSIH